MVQEMWEKERMTTDEEEIKIIVRIANALERQARMLDETQYQLKRIADALEKIPNVR